MSKKNPGATRVRLKERNSVGLHVHDARSVSFLSSIITRGLSLFTPQRNSTLHVPRRTHNGRIIIFNWINLNRIMPINPRPDAPLRCTRTREKIAPQITHTSYYSYIGDGEEGEVSREREREVKYDFVISCALAQQSSQHVL